MILFSTCVFNAVGGVTLLDDTMEKGKGECDSADEV